MDFTTNFKLKKPAQNDFYNIDDHNANADIIDNELKKLDTDKVSKVPGKDLSDNNYTNEEKGKLEGLPANAERNTIVGITLNGEEVSPDGYRKVNLNTEKLTNKITQFNSDGSIDENVGGGKVLKTTFPEPNKIVQKLQVDGRTAQIKTITISEDGKTVREEVV